LIQTLLLFLVLRYPQKQHNRVNFYHRLDKQRFFLALEKSYVFFLCLHLLLHFDFQYILIYQTTVATVLSVARRAKIIFEKSSDIAGKRQFLSYLLQNPTVNEKKLCFTIASPFNLVLELADNPNWLGR